MVGLVLLVIEQTQLEESSLKPQESCYKSRYQTYTALIKTLNPKCCLMLEFKILCKWNISLKFSWFNPLIIFWFTSVSSFIWNGYCHWLKVCVGGVERKAGDGGGSPWKVTITLIIILGWVINWDKIQITYDKYIFGGTILIWSEG